MRIPFQTTRTVRAMMSWALFGGGVACTAIAILLIAIVWLGEWTPAMEPRRLTYLGVSLYCALGGIGIVLVSLAIGGPVGRIKGSIGKLVTLEAQDDGHKLLETEEDSTPR